jgi:hypothetical protein
MSMTLCPPRGRVQRHRLANAWAALADGQAEAEAQRAFRTTNYPYKYLNSSYLYAALLGVVSVPLAKTATMATTSHRTILQVAREGISGICSIPHLIIITSSQRDQCPESG